MWAGFAVAALIMLGIDVFVVDGRATSRLHARSRGLARFGIRVAFLFTNVNMMPTNAFKIPVAISWGTTLGLSTMAAPAPRRDVEP